MLLNIVRMLFAAAIAVTLGFAWTVGQSGLKPTNTNLCELWASLPLPAYPSCEFQYILPAIWAAALCVAVLWLFIEICRFIRAFSSRRGRLFAYGLLAALLLIGAGVSARFFIDEYRRSPSIVSALPPDDKSPKTPSPILGAPPTAHSSPSTPAGSIDQQPAPRDYPTEMGIVLAPHGGGRIEGFHIRDSYVGGMFVGGTGTTKGVEADRTVITPPRTPPTPDKKK